MSEEKKTPKLTPAMREGINLKILRRVKENPELGEMIRERMRDRNESNK